MKKIIILFFISILFLAGCQVEPEAPIEPPVYFINYSPAAKPVLPALYACAAEFPDVIFSPKEKYYSALDSTGNLFILLGEPEILPAFSAPLVYDEVILVTNPANPITEWSDFRLINLVNGRIDNWDYLSWEGEVDLWLPVSQDEVSFLFNLHVLDGNPISQTVNLTSDHQEIVEAVIADPKAMGIVPTSFAVGDLTAHSLNIRIPLLAVLDSEPDEIQQEFLVCLQGEIGQAELSSSYEVLH